MVFELIMTYTLLGWSFDMLPNIFPSLLLSTLTFKFSKAVNLFETLFWYCSLKFHIMYLFGIQSVYIKCLIANMLMLWIFSFFKDFIIIIHWNVCVIINTGVFVVNLCSNHSCVTSTEILKCSLCCALNICDMHEFNWLYITVFYLFSEWICDWDNETWEFNSGTVT